MRILKKATKDTMRMQESVTISMGDLDLEAEENAAIIQVLANRDYHLPGNSWCQDWCAWIGNNHPLFGMCCRHQLHPVNCNDRLVNYMASIAFGLAITSGVAVYFAQLNLSLDDVIVTVPSVTLNATYPFNGNNTFIESAKSLSLMQYEYSVTNGDVILWTFGGALHSIFDLSVWHLTACSLCLPGGVCQALRCCRWWGGKCVLILAFITTAASMFVVLERATVEGGGNGNASFEFIKVYLIEVFLAQFCYFPFFFTVMFSGILGCGYMPVIGGRPRELRLEEQKQLKRRTTMTTATGGSSSL
jgi:hypothetical protein